MKEGIVQKALELGFDACGVTTAAAPGSADRFQGWLADGRHGEMAYLQRNASKRVDPQRVLAGARSVVVVAASYHLGSRDEESIVAEAGVGRVARYACFRDYHEVLGVRLLELAGYIDQVGGSGTRSLWYVDTGPVLERDLAQRAGLGFIGKHTNLISRRLGNWFFIGEILTTLSLAADSPERNRCGTCQRCLDVCPTRAITAPFQLDARRCISYLTIELKGSIPVDLRPAVGDRIFGCDDCLEVCPWNRFAREGRLLRDEARSEMEGVDLVMLLGLDEAGFRRRFEGTPVMRVKRRGLLRNVAVALGNVGGREVLPALEKAARDSEPLIAEHARWAADRIQSRVR